MPSSMVGDFHLNNAAKEMMLDEQRSIGPADGDLWDLAVDDYVDWLLRVN